MGQQRTSDTEATGLNAGEQGCDRAQSIYLDPQPVPEDLTEVVLAHDADRDVAEEARALVSDPRVLIAAACDEVDIWHGKRPPERVPARRLLPGEGVGQHRKVRRFAGPQTEGQLAVAEVFAHAPVYRAQI